jgi:hypothetical protein
MSKDFPGVRITKGNVDAIADALKVLADIEVLVGFPEETTQRPPDAERPDITNAALGYIHDNGEPDAHIPARPFMVPGMKRAEPEVEKYLTGALKATMQGKTIVAEQQIHGAGLAAQSAIRKTIDDGVPPPLAEATLRRRAAKGRKGAQQELDNRDAGLPPSMLLAKPLIDTGEMRKSVTYVIRSRKQRKK